jgi:hypothetical protein
MRQVAVHSERVARVGDPGSSEAGADRGQRLRARSAVADALAEGKLRVEAGTVPPACVPWDGPVLAEQALSSSCAEERPARMP